MCLIKMGRAGIIGRNSEETTVNISREKIDSTYFYPIVKTLHTKLTF